MVFVLRFDKYRKISSDVNIITFSVKNAVTIVLSVADITGTIKNGILISFSCIAHVIYVNDQDDPVVP